MGSFQTSLKVLSLALFLVFASQVKATTYTDRASFTAASQNLRSYDFDDQPLTGNAFTITRLIVDGIVFSGFGSIRIDSSGSNNKIVRSVTVGESTRLTVDLPPGTTAVGFEELGVPVKVQTSTGEEFTFTNQGAWNFTGFTSDVEIRSLRFETQFNNEVAPDIYLDNLLVGLQKSGQPIAPILFADQQSGLPIAFDSVTLVRDPFPVVSQQNFSTDHRTRITIFAVNLILAPGEDASAVSVQAEDAQHHFYDVPVESVNNTNLTWLTQVTAKLTDQLSAAGSTVNITLTVHGAVSNKLLVHITPQ